MAMATWKAFIFSISPAIANQVFQAADPLKSECIESPCQDKDGNECGGNDGFLVTCDDGQGRIESCTLPDCCSVHAFDVVLRYDCSGICKPEMKMVLFASENNYTGQCSEDQRTLETDCEPGLCYVDCKEELSTECVETTDYSQRNGVPQYMVMQSVSVITEAVGDGIPCTVGGMLPQMCSCYDRDCKEYRTVETPSGHYFFQITDTKGNSEYALLLDEVVLEKNAEGRYIRVRKPEPAEPGPGGKAGQAPAFGSKPATSEASKLPPVPAPTSEETEVTDEIEDTEPPKNDEKS